MNKNSAVRTGKIPVQPSGSQETALPRSGSRAPASQPVLPQQPGPEIPEHPPRSLRPVLFIGLPGCGKTTVSRRAAPALGLPWYDSDLEIEAAEGMDIPRIFAEKGEEYFRRQETRCIAGLLALGPAIIALGGGAVLRNAELLRQSGALVIYLERGADAILAALALEPGTRPLLKDPANLKKLADERREIYESLCSHKISNEGPVEDTVKKILEVCL